VTLLRLSYGTGTIAYRERPGADSGKTILLLHAFPLSSAMWDPLLAAHDGRHRLVVVDMRGFGQSDPFEGTLGMELAAADVCAVIDRIGTERVVLGGLSMGGYIALAFARLYPERLAGLVLADTRAGADSAEGRKGRHDMIDLVRKKGASAVADKMIPKLLSKKARTSAPEIVARIRSAIEATAPESIAAALAGMAERPDSTPLLGDIQIPTLVIVGSEDAVTPPEEAKAMADAIPGARLETIGGAGHLSSVEAPEEFARLLYGFVDSIGQGA
jgi:3-oxoadipate enol-lactonase